MSIYCPNCGENQCGGLRVCLDCGKVYCADCDRKGKNPYNNGGCPRCNSRNYKGIQDYNEIREAFKNSQN